MTLALLTPLLAASYQRAFAARFFWRSRSWPVAAGNCQDFSKIIVSGFLNEVLGIGQAGRLTAAALAGAGLQVIQEDLRPLDRHLLTAAPVDLPYAPVWLIHANPPEARIALFRHRHATWARTYRIGYWVWESSVAPYEWTDLARWFHSIWTPSGSSYDALVEAFRRAGRSDQIGKLRIVPHPVTVPSARSRSAGPVQALCLFDPRSDFDRKNPEGAVEAWLRAFPKPGQPRLVIKTLAQAAGHPRLSAVRGLAAQRGDIEICAETLDAVATEELVSRSHILLSLHRAEGFGLPLAEAMAHGLTVIATGWSGNMQFMTPNNALLVPYRLAAANANYNGPQAKWAEPDVDAAAVALRQAVGDASLRTRLGKRARADIEVLSRGWTHDALFL